MRWSFGWPMARAYFRVLDDIPMSAGNGWMYDPMTYLGLLITFRAGYGIPSPLEE